jgi:hypothetical protein
MINNVYFSLSYDRNLKFSSLLCVYGDLENGIIIEMYRAEAPKESTLRLFLRVACI